MVGKPPANSLYFYPRSPCGERLLYAMGYYRHSNFYPRSPCGERHGALKHVHQTEEISIHALLAESDFAGRLPSRRGIAISIHALLAESDTSSLILEASANIFLSTLSLRRATIFSQSAFAKSIFLSTLSLRRATVKATCMQVLFDISIHALLAESDTIFAVRPYDAPIFLSTLSLRRATLKSPCTIIDPEIFLSTLSLRRATAFRSPRIALIVDFYPRSPCGERPR